MTMGKRSKNSAALGDLGTRGRRVSAPSEEGMQVRPAKLPRQHRFHPTTKHADHFRIVQLL